MTFMACLYLRSLVLQLASPGMSPCVSHQFPSSEGWRNEYDLRGFIHQHVLRNGTGHTTHAPFGMKAKVNTALNQHLHFRRPRDQSQYCQLIIPVSSRAT
ncbi:hypothetical protein GY45DRAFT_702045 [Cubamyces sp. BRFM 1775]|nr:hypothetical protein GY45DRAFT_702045 [Cubamyces sp. BRFM 1775]